MNLYRIDLIGPDGSSYPLRDIAGVRLIGNATAARGAAREAAKEAGKHAALTRISGGGLLKHVGTYNPDGTFDRFGPEA